MENNQGFVIMAKPAGSRCTMRCSYCYYLEKSRYSTHEKQHVMSDRILDELIRDTVRLNPGPVVSFVWHGGEPTAAGLDFYKKAVETEKKYALPGRQIWNNLQTNGLTLNDEWCRFLKKNGFDVGLSIDGDALTHDANRRTVSGKPTHERIVGNIRRLMKFGIKPDLLCTVNPESVKDPLRVYRFLRDLGTGWIQFIPIVITEEDGSISPRSVSSEDYGRFLITVFDEWITNDLGKTDVQLFAETARIMAGGSASLCWMAPVCGMALIAEEDGGIYSCDHFVDDRHRLGTLGKEKLEDMVRSDFQRAFGNAKKDDLPEECSSCPYLRFCSGGCPKDRILPGKDGKNSNYLCKGLRMYFAHAEKYLSEAMKMSSEGKGPQEIMEYMKKNIV